MNSNLETAEGHRFICTESPNEDSCVYCDGVWARLMRRDGTIWRASWNGKGASQCPGVRGRVHNYYVRFCAEHDAYESCAHTDHDCNCLSCTDPSY